MEVLLLALCLEVRVLEVIDGALYRVQRGPELVGDARKELGFYDVALDELPVYLLELAGLPPHLVHQERVLKDDRSLVGEELYEGELVLLERGVAGPVVYVERPEKPVPADYGAGDERAGLVPVPRLPLEPFVLFYVLHEDRDAVRRHRPG